MNDIKLIEKVNSAMHRQCTKRGFAAPVDVLIEIGVLPKQKYEDWRFGRVDYLERVCTANLRKLSLIIHQMQVYAQKAGLKPSLTYYKQWGAKNKHRQKATIQLRFSKSGNPEIEKRYATHFVDIEQIAKLKEKQNQSKSNKQNDSSN